jgi:hypothetical protein
MNQSTSYCDITAWVSYSFSKKTRSPVVQVNLECMHPNFRFILIPKVYVYIHPNVGETIP